jgi:ABC-type branched-subunit amino acid transport system ATPase component
MKRYNVPTSPVDIARPAAPLVLRGLTAGYRGTTIVSDISLKLVPGEVHCVIGPNGAGKSTLVNAITGEAQVTAGSVLVHGTDVTGCSGEQLPRMGVGWVPQLKDVFPTLTVRENLEMGAYLLPRRQKEHRLSEVVELFPLLRMLINRSTAKLSGGERKLVALGRAIMTNPQVLLLDEPTASLSPEMSRVVLENYVRHLAGTGAAVLMVEQRARDALLVSDWAYVMTSGQIRISAPAKDVQERSDIGRLFLGSLDDEEPETGFAPHLEL